MIRNAPCPCGSGKRYKTCCGANVDATRLPPVRELAMAAHKAGLLGRAEALYRTVLQGSPEDIDVLHMLGVVQMQRLRLREALELLWEAAERTQWAFAEIRHNLGLVVAKLLTAAADEQLIAMQARFAAWEATCWQQRTHATPLVSVVMPAYNHRAYVAQALASVFAQTYRPIELIVVDDGSTDGTVDAIRECVTGAPVPVRFVARENRGAPATLNEGAALAQGAYVAFVNSDDWYAPERIARMVDEIANTGDRWGFSLVTSVHDGAHSAQEVDDAYRRGQLAALGRGSNSFALVVYNPSISTGNLFVERGLLLALGGFRDYRYNHDWDFCLRAASLAEPVVVREPLYFYRVHERNTIREARERVLTDRDNVLRAFVETALSGAATCTNPLAPQRPESRALLLREVINVGLGPLIPVPMLREVATELRAHPPEGRSAVRAAPAGASARCGRGPS